MHEGAGGILTVALTGATGFIGRRLQRHLLDRGYAVHALVRPGSPNRRHIDSRASAVEVALTDAAGLDAALRGADAVIYCAGSVRGSSLDAFRPVNVEGFDRVCAASAAKAQPPRVLLMSSLAATRPHLSDYARSKCEGEEVLRRQPALAWTILQPPAVYGPGDVELLPLFRAMRAGLALRIGPQDQRLSLLHVDDLAAAVVAWLDAPAACRHRSFTVDDGHPGGYGWNELRSALRGTRPALPLVVPRWLLAVLAATNLALARACHRAPMLTPGKVRELSEPSWLCDNSAYTAATGWYPRIAFRDGARALFGNPSRLDRP